VTCTQGFQTTRSWTQVGEAPTRLLAARSQQAGGGRSSRGVSPWRESPADNPSRVSRSSISPSRHASKKGESINGGSRSAHHRHDHSPSRRQSGHQEPIVVARDGVGLAGELAAEARQQELNLHKHHHHANILSFGEIGKLDERHVK